MATRSGHTFSPFQTTADDDGDLFYDAQSSFRSQNLFEDHSAFETMSQNPYTIEFSLLKLKLDSTTDYVNYAKLVRHNKDAAYTTKLSSHQPAAIYTLNFEELNAGHTRRGMDLPLGCTDQATLPELGLEPTLQILYPDIPTAELTNAQYGELRDKILRWNADNKFLITHRAHLVAALPPALLDVWRNEPTGPLLDQLTSRGILAKLAKLFNEDYKHAAALQEDQREQPYDVSTLEGVQAWLRTGEDRRAATPAFSQLTFASHIRQDEFLHVMRSDPVLAKCYTRFLTAFPLLAQRTYAHLYDTITNYHAGETDKINFEDDAIATASAARATATPRGSSTVSQVSAKQAPAPVPTVSNSCFGCNTDNSYHASATCYHLCDPTTLANRAGVTREMRMSRNNSRPILDADGISREPGYYKTKYPKPKQAQHGRSHGRGGGRGNAATGALEGAAGGGSAN
jgi:hypothetical protein